MYRANILVLPQQSQAELLVSSIFIHSVLAVPMFCQKSESLACFTQATSISESICDGFFI